MNEWYLEYHIYKDRFGLLGDIASLLGMMAINIETLRDIEDRRRGFLIRTDDPAKIESLRTLLEYVENIKVTALRQPTLLDRLALRHGKLITKSEQEEKVNTYQFTREELGMLVDFLGEHLKVTGNQVMGIRGMPRVGKTESLVAASVYAGKRWTVVSSTLLKQTIRTDLEDEEFSTDDHVYIIDGIVSTLRGNEDHMRLVKRILRLDAPKIIEHPDIFVQHSEFNWNLFDRVIELRNTPDEEITYEALEHLGQ